MANGEFQPRSAFQNFNSSRKLEALLQALRSQQVTSLEDRPKWEVPEFRLPLNDMMGEPAPRVPMGTSGERAFATEWSAGEPSYGLPIRPPQGLGQNRPTFSPELEAANARLRQSGTQITPQFLAMETRGPLANYQETIRQLDALGAPARMELTQLKSQQAEIEERIKEVEKLEKERATTGIKELTKGTPRPVSSAVEQIPQQRPLGYGDPLPVPQHLLERGGEFTAFEEAQPSDADSLMNLFLREQRGR